MRRGSEIIGWLGVVAILSAYLLNILDIINSSDLSYSVLNLGGAIAIAIDAWRQKNYQPVVLNIIWAVAAAFALLKIVI